MALVVACPLYDDVGGELTAGTTTLMLFEVQTDGTLFSFDFNDNTFKSTALTTATASMTVRTGNNSTQTTGVWSAVVSTVTDFVVNSTYIARIENATAYPTTTKLFFTWATASGTTVVGPRLFPLLGVGI